MKRSRRSQDDRAAASSTARPGSNPPVPVVWGISATIDRFTAAMEGETADRTDYPHVEVDIDKVRASGLVKDEIGLDEPDEKGTFATTLLREAVRATLDFERRWAAYSAAEDEPDVLPVMVVQVPDKASEDKLAEMVVGDRLGVAGPGPDAIAHVFGEHERASCSGRAPSSGCTPSRSRTTPTSGSCSPRKPSPRAGTAPVPRCSTASGRPRTPPTSPR